MAFEFRLPDIGEGVVEGEVVKWHVKTGDPIAVDQPMVEVMTDKATVEIPSPRAGVVKELRAAEGSTAKVGSVLLVIEEVGSSPEPRKPELHAVPQLPTANSQLSTSGKVLATPATRKLARDLGVDLAAVAATGPNGRVTKDDVQAAAGGHVSVAAVVQPAALPIAAQAGDERIPFRGVRKKIAENMHRSRQTAAHFTYVEECDMTELVALRARAKKRAEERGVKLSFLPFIVKAVCAGLKKFPIVNSTLDEGKGEIVLRKRYHIGVAAATADGLIVPVVKDADQRSLFDIAKTLEELSDKARAGKASRDDLTGSTFTISS